MTTFDQAKREAVPLIIGIAGASGSGKTNSMLRIARGIAGDQPFALIDTEQRRSRIYADHYQPWIVGDLDPPFSPARYLEAIEAAVATGVSAVVIDQMSHEQDGEGGLLDMFDVEFGRLNRRESMRMAAWIRPKDEHKKLMRRLVRQNTHLIIGLRAEEKVEMRPKADGSGMEVVKMQVATGADGWVPICEKRLPYELTLSLLVTPSQPGVPKPIKLPEDLKPLVPLDRVIDESVGAALAKWAAGDAPVSASLLTVEELEADLRDLAELAGKLETVETAIARARAGRNAADYAGWLERQIERAKEAQ